jgi:4-hydroxybenzoate polyprenyltransferase
MYITPGEEVEMFNMYQIIKMLRPHQWIKNAVCFAALIFGQKLFLPEGQGLNWPDILKTLEVFAAFCLLSSGVYIFNDVCDRHRDRQHPEKKNRPVASGAVSPFTALVFCMTLVIASLALALSLNFPSFMVLLIYASVMLLYTLHLKHLVVVDVMTIGFGFCLRAIGGATAIGIPMSSWLLLCAFVLALFLGFGKRRHELLLLEREPDMRPDGVFKKYDMFFLNEMSAVCAACAVMSYGLYVTSTRAHEVFGHSLILTMPFVIYGIFRFLYQIHFSKRGNPSEIVYSDKVLLITVGLWIASVVLLLKYGKGLTIFVP